MPKINVPSGHGGPGNNTGGTGRPPGQLNTQTWLRIQRIARMEVGGVADRFICKNENIDYAALSYLRKLPEYQEVKEDLLQGHLTELDKALAGKVDILRGEMRNAVPAALRAIVDVVNQRRDLRSALAASREILNRDPDRLFLESKDPSAVGVSDSRLPDAIMDSVTDDATKVNQDLATKVIQ